MVRTSSVLPEMWANPSLRSGAVRLPTPDGWFDDVALAVQVHSRQYHAGELDWEKTVSADGVFAEHGIAHVAVTPRQITREASSVLRRIERAYEQATKRPPAHRRRPIHRPVGCGLAVRRTIHVAGTTRGSSNGSASSLPTCRRPRPDKGLTRQVRAMRSGMDAATRRANAAAQIFLSYRAGGDEAARGARQVMLRGLADRVARGEFHEGAARRAFYYTPGAVAFEDELLSEARHWQVAASIDRQLATADELWIVDTPDYLGVRGGPRRTDDHGLPDGERIEPARAAPLRSTTSEVHPEPADLLPPFTKPQRKRMARGTATLIGQHGPQGVVAIRQLGFVAAAHRPAAVPHRPGLDERLLERGPAALPPAGPRHGGTARRRALPLGARAAGHRPDSGGPAGS